MIISTTSELHGQRVTEYLGIVSGEAIMGANIIKDFFAKVRDVALAEMQAEAVARGANAIIGVDLDYETVGETSSMLMVSCSGTAVKTATA